MRFQSLLAQAAPAFNFEDRLSFLQKLRLRPVKSDSIALVHQLPPTLRTFATLRSGLFQNFVWPDRSWAELRGDVVLIYPASDLLQLHIAAEPVLPNGEIHQHNSAALERLEAMPEDYVTTLAQKVDPTRVTSFVLPVTKIAFNDKQRRISFRASRQLADTSLCFMGLEEMMMWQEACLAALAGKEKNLSDFSVVRELGKGASGRVYLVEDNETKEQLALKVIQKSTVYESDDSYRHAHDERLVLQMTKNHPFTLEMRYAFQNAKRFFLLTEYCPGGDMFEYMERRPEPMGEDTARLVAAEILLALQHIHGINVVYRDLKLENILLDAHGHIRVADFGLSKLLQSQNGDLKRTNSFCGTREYIAPEMLKEHYYDTTLDLWTFGILLYEMLTGKTPFYTVEHHLIYKRIEKSSIYYPQYLSEDVRNLLESLLKREPAERLGAEAGIEDIKKHAWFKDIDWTKLENMEDSKGPLHEHSARVSERPFLYMDPISHVTARRTKRQAKKERALATLLADVEEDLKYVCDVREKLSAEAESDVSGSKVARKPRSPLAKRARAVMAGYSFCSD